MADTATGSKEAPDDNQVARQEVLSAVVALAALVVVLLLAGRGVFSAVWYFPPIFAVVMVVLAVLSLRKARAHLFRPRLALAVVICSLALLLPWQHTRGVAAKVAEYERRVGEALIGKPAPPLPFVAAVKKEYFDENTLALGGRVTLLNFWATWCAPCIAEMPLLETFWQQSRDRGIDVIGVTKLYDRTSPIAGEVRAVEAFLEERGTTYPVIIGDRRSPIHASYLIGSLPSSILVGRDGKVIDVGAGIKGTQRLMERAEQLASSDSL